MPKAEKKNKTIKIKGTGKADLILRLVSGVILVVLIYAIMSISIEPPRYNLAVGEIADETIKATKDVVDRVSTAEKHRQVRASVNQMYKQDSSITSNILDKIGIFFANIVKVRSAASLAKQLSSGASYTQEFLDSQRTVLGIQLKDEELLYIFDTLSDNQIETSKTVILAKVEEFMSITGIKEEYLEEQKIALKNELSVELKSSGISDKMIHIAGQAIDAYVQANMLKDDEATERARKEAEALIEDIIYKKGQTIVASGEPVTAAQLEVIKDLGLFNDKSSDIYLNLGLLIFAVMTVAILLLYLYTSQIKFYNSYKKVIIVMIIFAFSLLVSMLISYANVMLMPVVLGAMLITLLLNMQTAVVVNILLSVAAGIIAYYGASATAISSFIVLASNLIGGCVASYLAKKSLQRYKIALAGLAGGLSSAVIVLSISILFISDTTTVLQNVVFAFASTLLASILCLGTLPLWEIIFKEYTPIRLLELANHNNELLQKLLREAPGSYHHSLLVANIAENCAAAIGADELLVRTGAYFHDVGKIIAPRFFKENQIHENPHDALTPEESVRHIARHTVDGSALARKAKLPESIVKIIEEHHGSMPVLYFYQEAKQLYGENNIRVEDYQYDGPIPTSKESAIVMLADATEAAVRAMNDHSQDNIKSKINDIIEIRKEMRQFDNCDLSFKELRIIEQSLNNTMCRLYHERIEYMPEATKPLKIKKNKSF